MEAMTDSMTEGGCHKVVIGVYGVGITSQTAVGALWQLTFRSSRTLSGIMWSASLFLTLNIASGAYL